ncbi:uncharacterized protein [Misgurnus anguillicaudatus]|uniref:uncharacterized protein n=1 Tax=Misgurnus anguillicaudatus TaxID=75329 RepID=UPI003CCF5060
MDTQDSEEDSGKMEREHTLSANLLTEDHYRCSVCTEVFKNPVSIPCGHSYCKHCIEIYWSKPTQAECYACPQCRKRFRDRPVLYVNVALAKLIEERQRAGFSPSLADHCYARPKDVLCSMSCDIKTTRISRAVKIIQDEILTATVTKQKSTLKERDVKGKRVCKGFEVQCKARPGRPSVTKLNRNTIRLTWLKAEADEDCPVLQYMVEYREAGLEGWSSVLTQGSECECTLTVPHSTCYSVRVSAVYEDITSKPSEETSVPVDVWTINLSKRKTSILLEVLKLQTEKKPVELIDWTDDESEEGFIQCLPYISQLRFTNVFYKRESVSQFLVNLFTAASEFDTNTEEKYTELLTSVCNYATFPCEKDDDDFEYQIEQCDFLLDLYSHVKNYENLTDRSVLPALQSIYQSSPAVWTINLSERKTSILLEVLKLQTEKKPVELIDWTDDESEVRGFIQCLPYISQLRFTHVFYEKRESVVQFLVNLFTATSEFDTNTEEKYTELLKSVCCYTTFPFNKDYFDDFEYLVDQCSFLLDLYSHVKNYESQTGRSLLPALQSIYQSSPAVWTINLSERKTSILLEVLKLQTEKKPVELIDWTDDESEVRGFIQCLPYISQLRNAEEYIPSLCKVFGPKVNRDEVTPLLQALGFTVTLSEKLPSSTCRCVGRVLSLSSSKLNLTLKSQAISLEGVTLLFRHITHLQTLSLEGSMVMKMVSSLTSFLRRLSVQFLDLTKCKIDAASVTALLCLQGLQTIRLSKETLQQLVSVVYEAQDDELTRCFLKKVSEDLTSCSLTWEVIQYLLQHQPLHLKLDFRKNKITCENIRDLLPWLDRINFKRLTPSFILSIIMEIYESRSPQFVSGLLSSAENDINLKNKVLNSDQCSALCFTLQHCNTVKLNLFWTSIPEEELKRLLPLLNRVTQLSVDRQLLLKLLHCCSSSDDQQEAANLLLSALQYRLDFSSCSILDLTVTQKNKFNLTSKDCKIISSVLQKSQSVVKLVLEDCEVSDSAVKHLLPVLSQVQLSCGKALLLQFIACITEDAEKESLRWVQSLSQALGGEVDLSHTQMDQRSCEQLSVFLEYSDGLTELDLSHCRLTDQYMNPLLPHLHKTQTLDLSHNNITDELAKKIHSVVSTHDNIQTVRLFGNRIRDKQQFTRVKQIEIW